VKPDIGSESRFLPTPPAFDDLVRGVPVGILLCRLVWKTRMVWLPGGEKILFIRFDRMYERDRQTDGQTDKQTAHDDIGRACIALRGILVFG